MRNAASCAALLSIFFSGVLAASVLLSPQGIELTNIWGDTLANATAEARLNTEVCGKSGNTCLQTAPSPRQLVPASGTCESASPVVGWRQASELPNANRVVAELQSHAATRELFDCTGPVCLAVVPTTTPNETQSGVATLSVCSVRLVLGVPGPPSQCQEALKQQGRSVLLRGQVGNSFTGCGMGLRDFDAVFKGRARDIGSVRKLVGEVLGAKPFNLTVTEDGRALVGTRAHLASEVLTGWREWITVRVDLDIRGDDAGTTIFTTMLVSKQATASREAWTPPSEPQEAAYLFALRNAFQGRGGVLSTGVGR